MILTNIETRSESTILNKIQFLKEELEKLRANKKITCPACEEQTPLSEATVINTYYYVEPYSCNGGAYHSHTGYKLYCSKCKEITRAVTLSGDMINRDESYVLENIKPEALKEPRVRLYLFIKKHYQYFGEKLHDYNGNTNVAILRDEERKRRQQKEDELYEFC